jgi:hypothetical protein
MFIKLLITRYVLGKKYSGNIEAANLLVTPTTISTNVHRLADEYRLLLRSILVEQAASGCLCLCPDLWSDKHRKVNYLGLTAVFVDKNYELFSVDLCCCEQRCRTGWVGLVPIGLDRPWVDPNPTRWIGLPFQKSQPGPTHQSLEGDFAGSPKGYPWVNP